MTSEKANVAYDAAKYALRDLHERSTFGRDPVTGLFSYFPRVAKHAEETAKFATDWARQYVKIGAVTPDDQANLALASVLAHALPATSPEEAPVRAHRALRGYGAARGIDVDELFDERDLAMIGEAVAANVAARSEEPHNRRIFRALDALPVPGGEFPLVQRLAAVAELSWIASSGAARQALWASMSELPAELVRVHGDPTRGRFVLEKEAMSHLQRNMAREKCRVDTHEFYLSGLDIECRRRLSSLEVGHVTQRISQELATGVSPNAVVLRAIRAAKFIENEGRVPSQAELREFIKHSYMNTRQAELLDDCDVLNVPEAADVPLPPSPEETIREHLMRQYGDGRIEQFPAEPLYLHPLDRRPESFGRRPIRPGSLEAFAPSAPGEDAQPSPQLIKKLEEHLVQTGIDVLRSAETEPPPGALPDLGELDDGDGPAPRGPARPPEPGDLL